MSEKGESYGWKEGQKKGGDIFREKEGKRKKKEGITYDFVGRLATGGRKETKEG